MRITKKVSPFLALAALATGLGSLSLIQQPKTQAVLAADSSSSSSTITDSLFAPGSFIYVNCLSYSTSTGAYDKWAMPNHKMVFRFTDANGTIVFTNWVVSHANDGNYFYVGAVPSHPGNSTAAWTSLCVILYSTSSTSPSSDYSAAGTAYGSSPRTLAMTPEITAIAQKGTSVGTLPSGTVTSGTLNEISITSATSLPNPSVQANVIPTIQTYFASHWDTKSSDFDRMSFWCGDQFLPDTDVCCSAISNATTFQNYIQYYWKNTLAPSFGTLTSTQTGFFKTGTGLNYGTINDAIARYDRVYYLHHNTYPTLITDFAGRNPATISGASVTPSSSQNNSSVFVLAGLSAIAVLAAGSYFFIRKKKAD